MISVSDFPAVNAALNALSAFFLGVGYVSIRLRHITLHRVLMLSAFVTSTLFLICYIIYHVQVGSVGFGGEGWVRPVYFTILITHILLAAVLLPLVLVTLYRALRSQFAAHRRLARWTFPIWMYVSVTGVVIYVAVYHVFGPAPQAEPAEDTHLTGRMLWLEYPPARANRANLEESLGERRHGQHTGLEWKPAETWVRARRGHRPSDQPAPRIHAGTVRGLGDLLCVLPDSLPPASRARRGLSTH